MHIAFLTPEYPHKSLNKSGGLGTSIYNLAVALYQKGIKVSIIVPYQESSALFMDNGISIHCIKRKKFGFLNWFFYKKYVQKIINSLCTREKIDLIEGPDWTGIGSFIAFNVPYVVRLNGSDSYFCHIEKRKQFYKNYWLEKRNFTKAKAVLSASTYTGEVTNQVFKTSRKITTIYNSIDAAIFKPKLDAKINPYQVLYFGTLIRKKGVLDFARAINSMTHQNSDIKILFLGKDVIDYKEKKSTKTIIESILSAAAKKATTFLEAVPYEEVKPIIQAAQVICLPSYAEAFPMTWLESMALEKAMVTSNVGWANEMMIDGETGYTVHPSDHQLMATRILELCLHPDLCKKMGFQARQRILSTFSTEIIVEQNLDFYNKILSQ